MNDKPISGKNFNYSINNAHNHADILKLGKALSKQERLDILKLLQAEPKYLVEIAESINMPLSSVSRHIDILAEAGLIIISYTPGPKGHSKLCAKAVMSANISFEDIVQTSKQDKFITEMPIGLYADCKISAPCGMLGSDAPILDYDNPSIFFSPERVNAELLWFNVGFISYNLPMPSQDKFSAYNEISISLELCSETIYHRNKWPSDITISINDKELTTFTSPGDFGGRRGKLTPSYWPVISTQYGLLMTFTVNKNGVYVNDVLKNSSITIDDLMLCNNNFAKLTLEIKEDALHRGGINIFGKHFGDYAQAIIMSLC